MFKSIKVKYRTLAKYLKQYRLCIVPFEKNNYLFFYTDEDILLPEK